MQDIDVWLGMAREHIGKLHPEQLPLFDVFAAEANFGRQWLNDSLAALQPGANVLEVGAGLMLLACQLRREGYVVTALEPLGEGFSAFNQVQILVLELARAHGFAPEVRVVPVESLGDEARFDLAYSVNVMEHVGNIDAALAAIAAALVPGGRYRFTCPNYRFPYEPHFNIPTLFSKRLTERVFGTRIFGNQRMDDPAGVWRSLNWIDVGRVRRSCAAIQGVMPYFRRDLLVKTLARLARDREFASRRAAWMRGLGKFLAATGIHRLAGMIPAGLQPIIDCELVKTGATGAHARYLQS
ncbi:MAG: methyltransferase domain-containing protein [Thiobacillus sp.]|nr:methyltransferase domain-containing protein [Thiobacillus sp.]